MNARTKAMDWAAFWFVLAALIVATAAVAQLYFLVAVALFPARWGVARIVDAIEAGRAMPPPADKPFGYEQGGPPS